MSNLIFKTKIYFYIVSTLKNNITQTLSKLTLLIIYFVWFGIVICKEVFRGKYIGASCAHVNWGTKRKNASNPKMTDKDGNYICYINVYELLDLLTQIDLISNFIFPWNNVQYFRMGRIQKSTKCRLSLHWDFV